MLIFPFSTALQLAQRPIVTIATALLCILVFIVQISTSITDSLVYVPDVLNPVKMITASLAHSGPLHLVGNLVFFLAFAPALEILVGNRWRFVWIMLVISFASHLAFSFSVFVGAIDLAPTLGLSGVVMGMIGLSAFLMPRARIKVFWWYIVFWKIFLIPAWILALVYIGLDTWEMLTAEDYAGINIVSHVAGGVAGYLYGYLFLRDRRDETHEELTDEIEEMALKRQFGSSASMSFRGRKEQIQQETQRQKDKEYKQFMSRIYQKVMTNRDSEAVLELMDSFEKSDMEVTELEELYSRIAKWKPSRTLLCLGRWIIDRLENEKKYGRALIYIEKCQQVRKEFILPDVRQVLFYAKMAMETGKHEVAKALLGNSLKRYGVTVEQDECKRLMNQLYT